MSTLQSLFLHMQGVINITRYAWRGFWPLALSRNQKVSRTKKTHNTLKIKRLRLATAKNVHKKKKLNDCGTDTVWEMLRNWVVRTAFSHHLFLLQS
jgi:hypothetical protein